MSDPVPCLDSPKRYVRICRNCGRVFYTSDRSKVICDRCTGIE